MTPERGVDYFPARRPAPLSGDNAKRLSHEGVSADDQAPATSAAIQIDTVEAWSNAGNSEAEPLRGIHVPSVVKPPEEDERRPRCSSAPWLSTAQAFRREALGYEIDREARAASDATDAARAVHDQLRQPDADISLRRGHGYEREGRHKR
jgi:hypothetical protein